MTLKMDSVHSEKFEKFINTQKRTVSYNGDTYSISYQGDKIREKGELVGKFMDYANLPTKSTSWYDTEERVTCCDTPESRLPFLVALLGDEVVSDIRKGLSDTLGNHPFYRKYSSHFIGVKLTDSGHEATYKTVMSAADQSELKILLTNPPESLPKLSDFLRTELRKKYGSVPILNEYVSEQFKLGFEQ